MPDSRQSGLYRLDIAERIDALEAAGLIRAGDAALLRTGRQVLLRGAADKMVENVLGCFGLPLAVATNFIVNDTEMLVPMVVEEASVLAGVSAAAALARSGGGFRVSSAESLLAGQVHVTGVPDTGKALAAILAEAGALQAAANAKHPRLIERGGGVVDVGARELEGLDGALVVELFVDTCDAMGANLVNAMCEAVAPQVAAISGGDVALRILSNLADRSVYRAGVRYPLDVLGGNGFTAEAVRDRIVTASAIAAADTHRAVTHNKGIMNGVDAVAVATGNDWRAIEAGAHAFAARTGRYRPLAVWSVAENGELCGDIEIPLKVGIVGGSQQSNPGARLALSISAVRSADELASLMAAVGLAQNFAALRALATSGIQQGHMRLHARSVAAAAEVPDALFEQVVGAMIAADEIKVAKARQLCGELARDTDRDAMQATAAGKVILLGEHAVVYGKHALAVPIPDAVAASVQRSAAGLAVSIPEWQYERRIEPGDADGVAAAISLIVERLGLAGQGFAVRIRSGLPAGMGLGSSAALAVAVLRAFDAALELGLDDGRVNEIAFDCEKLAHGTPSGVDNTIATYAQTTLFRKAADLQQEVLDLQEPPPLLIACSHERGLTRHQVAGVRQRHARFGAHYEAVFAQLDQLCIAAAAALQRRDYEELGGLMNIAHGMLHAIEVSTPELDAMVAIARSAGATGAKLTGAGGGGSIVALCPAGTAAVEAALTTAGYRVLSLEAQGSQQHG